MSLSNTAVPIYYGKFRDAVLAHEIPVNEEVLMEMERIEKLIRNPGVFYDDKAVNGFIAFCEKELTLTDGSELNMLDSFKLWAEEIFGWYYYVERDVWVKSHKKNKRGRIVKRLIKKRLTNKQFVILGRGGAKTMYASCVQGYFLIMDPATTQQVTTAPTMKQAEEVLSPLRTAIVRSRGPLFTFLTESTIRTSKGSSASTSLLLSTKKGVENRVTNSILEVKPMEIDKLQGLRCKVASVDEWLSGDIREDPIGALEQSAAKGNIEDYIILAISSEGTVRNAVGDTIKMELMDILKGKYDNPHVSIWYYRLDSEKEVADPDMWLKANPNIGKTVSYETYQLEVERAEHVPAAKNDILAKRFGIPREGFTYFFTYEETLPVERKTNYWGLPCSLGADLSMGDDFCAFSFLFPLPNESFGIKVRCYISTLTYQRLPRAMRMKYDEFIQEGSLVVMEGTILDMIQVYDDLDQHIAEQEYDIRSFGFDPYNAKDFVDRWISENSEYGVEKVPQGSRTESVPLGEIKKLSENGMLIFDQELMSFCMGNCIALADTNGNRKLYKKRNDQKIDSVAATMDAYIAYKLHKDDYE